MIYVTCGECQELIKLEDCQQSANQKERTAVYHCPYCGVIWEVDHKKPDNRTTIIDQVFIFEKPEPVTTILNKRNAPPCQKN